MELSWNHFDLHGNLEKSSLSVDCQQNVFDGIVIKYYAETLKEEFEDTKRVIRIRKLTTIQHNSQMKKDKQRSTQQYT